jgi:RNA polymerase sigma-70 factor (ECF subfamily)
MKDAQALGKLLDQARAGDQPALNTLLERLRPFVKALLLRQMRQPADASDLTQEVQLRMGRGFAGFRGSTVPELLAWIRQIAVRVVLDHLRRQPPTPEPLLADPVCPGSAIPGARLDHAEDLVRLQGALERLPELQRRVIEQRFFDGLPCVGIAQRMDRSPEWVRITCMRALGKLHGILSNPP